MAGWKANPATSVDETGFGDGVKVAVDKALAVGVGGRGRGGRGGEGRKQSPG